ncbi:MAG: outer membrane beta-barrel protein [Alphaproteobacteria bacterium]|nr:outer membrane beta-barrel protein [Alphaproteobacteria bacterium]
MKFQKFLYGALLLGSGIAPATAKIGGFYVGAHVGAEALQGTHTYSNGIGSSGKQKVSAFGYLAGLSVGYLKQLQASPMVFGGEIYGSMAGPKAKKNLQIVDGPIEGSATLSHKYSIGGAVMAGAAINPKILMYTKLGYEIDKIAMDYTFPTQPTEKYTKSSTTYIPGAGVLYTVSPSLLIGAEYGYAIIKKMQPRKDAVAINGASRGYSFSPVAQRVTIKAIYMF